VTATRYAFARPFLLERHRDVSGVSGTGVVAWGAEFPDGTVVLRWLGRTPSTAVHDHGILAVMAVHGHGGATEVVWADETPAAGAGGLEELLRQRWEAVMERRSLALEYERRASSLDLRIRDLERAIDRLATAGTTVTDPADAIRRIYELRDRLPKGRDS